MPGVVDTAGSMFLSGTDNLLSRRTFSSSGLNYLIITLSMIPGLGYYLTNIPIVSHGKVGKCKLDATGYRGLKLYDLRRAKLYAYITYATL